LLFATIFNPLQKSGKSFSIPSLKVKATCVENAPSPEGAVHTQNVNPNSGYNYPGREREKEREREQ